MTYQSSFEARLMQAQIKALEDERDRKETLREFLYHRIDAINEALAGGVRLKAIHQEVIKEGYATSYSTFYSAFSDARRKSERVYPQRPA